METKTKLKAELIEMGKQNIALLATINEISNALTTLKRAIGENPKLITKPQGQKFKDVIDIVCTYYGIPERNIYSKERTRETHALPRHMVFYLLMDVCDFTCTEAARLIKKDHTTALHGRRKIVELIKFNKEVLKDYLSIKEMLIETREFNPELFNI